MESLGHLGATARRLSPLSHRVCHVPATKIIQPGRESGYEDALSLSHGCGFTKPSVISKVLAVPFLTV